MTECKIIIIFYEMTCEKFKAVQIYSTKYERELAVSQFILINAYSQYRLSGPQGLYFILSDLVSLTT